MIKTNITGQVKFGLLIIFLVIFLDTVTNAATYYVRTDGNNNNDGLTNSSGGAWRTIDFAADNVSSGDVIRVQAGTYAEEVSPGVNGTNANTTVTFVADGTVNVCGFDLNDSEYIRIIGFVIDADVGGCSADLECINLSGTPVGIEIWNNEIKDANETGIRQSGWPSASNYADGLIIVGNTIHNIAYDQSGSGNAISVPMINSLIAYNTIYDIYCDGFYIWGHDNRWLNNYSYNLLETYGGHADVWQAGSNYLGLENNLFEAHFQVGAGDLGDEHAFQISHTQSGYCQGGCGDMTENIFRRNVFHNNSEGIGGVNQTNDGSISYTRIYHNTGAEACENAANSSVRYGYTLYGNNTSDSYIYNNLEYEIWGNSATSNLYVHYVTGGLTSDYNLAYDPDGSVTFTSPWTGQSHAQSNADPDFNDYNNDDFTLGSQSQAIGNAGPLTTTSGSGTGTTFNVVSNTGGYFRGDDTNINQYGGNLVVGDIITVGTDVVRISSISGDAITVTESFTWANGENVYYGDDITPDIGAYPYKSGGYDYTAAYSISGSTVTVAPSDASLVRMVVVFEDGIPIGVDSIEPYSISGIGSGTLDVRVYPLYASPQLFVTATQGSGAPPTKTIGVDIVNDEN